MYILEGLIWCPKSFPLGAGSIFRGGGSLKFRGGVVKKRQSPDFRFPEVGISAFALHYHFPKKIDIEFVLRTLRNVLPC